MTNPTTIAAAPTGFSTEVLFDEVRDALQLANALRAAKEERKKRAPSSRWALVFCGLVATAFAGAAFTESPLGQSAGVKPHVDALRDRVGVVAEHARELL